MKNLSLIILILFSICLSQTTIRIVSDGSESVSPPYTTFVVPSNPAPPYPGTYTVWGNTIRGFIDPVCWSKIIHRDGAQWISVSPTGRVSWLGSYTFRKDFHLPALGADWKFSRATIWLSVDDECDIYINGTYIGSVSGFEYLHRIDFNDRMMGLLRDGATNTLELTVTNTRHSFTGVIYYMSIDYGEKTYFEDKYLSSTCCLWYRSIPLRIDNTVFPDLTYIFTGYVGSNVWIYNPHTGSWDSYPITTPLTDDFADLIRRFSFFILTDTRTTEYVKGWPILEQRYLDLQPDVRRRPHTGWGHRRWYPIGTVICEVPFDWYLGEPDDEPDDGTWWPTWKTYYWNKYLCNWQEISPRVLKPYEGYITFIRDYPGSTPDERNNAHLDLSCYYYFHGGPPEVPHTTSVEPDTEIILPPYDSVDIDTSLPPPPDTSDTSSGSPKIGAKISLLPKPLVVPYPNPFNTKTTFYYYVFEKCYAEFDIYDIYGRLVKSLYKGNVDYGNGRVEWDGTDNNGHPVASGTYIYRFRYSSGESKGTVILIK